MTLSELWWLLPLLLVLVCCILCGRMCGCMRMRRDERNGQRRAPDPRDAW